MKIQQGTKGDFGDFELVPEEGFEIWRPFIDFESKLLIAKEIAIRGEGNERFGGAKLFRILLC